jgi:hypothetical protein
MIKVTFLLLGAAFAVNGQTTTDAPFTEDTDRVTVSGLGPITDSLIFKFSLTFYNANTEQDRIVEVLQIIIDDLDVNILNVTSVIDAGIVDGQGILIAELLLSPDEIEDLITGFQLPDEVQDITTGETTNGVTTETDTGETFVGIPMEMDKVQMCSSYDAKGKKGKSLKKKGAKCKKSKKKSKKTKKSKKSGKGKQTTFFRQKHTQAAFGVSIGLLGVGTVVVGALYGKRHMARRGMKELEEWQSNKVEVETTPLLILE